jgi:hypothetical protein
MGVRTFTGSRLTSHCSRVYTHKLNIQLAIKSQQTILQAAVKSALDVDAPMKLAILQN